MRAQPNNDRGLETAPGAYDDPERRPLGERCLLGFGSTAGPPALPNYFYNNLHKIVQTPNTVLIINEMVHDVRVVRMNAQHLPKHIRKWMGDSVGRWEGDTLVVDTTNFNARSDSLWRCKPRRAAGCSWLRAWAQSRRIGCRARARICTWSSASPALRTTRCCIGSRSRTPARGSRRGRVNSPGRQPTEQIYEYACHEANYAMENILRGARRRERMRRAPLAGPDVVSDERTT